MIQRLHIVSGLILFGYLLVHFVNHSLLVVSITTADRFLSLIHPYLTTPLVTATLLGALILHVALALLALWRRRTLRFTVQEALQYALGFAMPLALLPHIAGTRIPDTVYELNWGYYRNLLPVYWVFEPWRAASQTALLLGAWMHAMLGLHAWLRLKPWVVPLQPLLFALALLLPTLALAGFVAGGNEARLRLARDPAFAAGVRADAPSPAIRAEIEDGLGRLQAGLALTVLGVFGARLVRDRLRRRRGLVRIAYPDGKAVTVPRGVSVLEASALRGYPHASVCGGRGRCSTCRVRVVAEPAVLPAPSAEEARVLARIRAAPDVRLACQLRPIGPVSVTPLLDPALPPRTLLSFRTPMLLGEERTIAVLFVDIRGFTRLAEHRLPYDVVHLLNRYFRAMGEAVEAAGGQVDKFIGDGVMALFGAEGRAADPDDEAEATAEACRSALDGARRISLALAGLNRSVAGELGEKLRIGIGLHAGPVILGALGHGRTIGLTAIGDTVNTASRLESATKEFGCELVVSDFVLEAAGLAWAPGEPQLLMVRGRDQPLPVRAIRSGQELPEPARPVERAARPIPAEAPSDGPVRGSP